MTSEINNLIRGNVVSTIEFDTNKKIIGVSTANLIPNEAGIAPLGKQGAFKVEKEEAIETFDIAVNDALATPVEETIENFDLTKIGEPAQSGKFIPEPQESDIVLENPVDVSGLNTLSSLSSPVVEEAPEASQVIEPQIETPSFDIQMPEMPEQVVAEAPSGLNDNLFVDTPSEALSEVPVVAPTLESAPEVVSPKAPVFETASVDLPSLSNDESLEKQDTLVEVAPVLDLDSILEQKRKELIDRINALTEAEILKYSEEIKDLISNNIGKTKGIESNTKTDVVDTSLMNDALSHIDSIVSNDVSNGISM